MSSLSRCPDYDIPIPRSDQMSPMSRFPDVPIFRSPDQPITGSPDLFGSFDTSIKPFKIDEYFPSQAPVFVWRLIHAEVAELADAHGSGPCTRKGVGVRVPSS